MKKELGEAIEQAEDKQRRQTTEFMVATCTVGSSKGPIIPSGILPEYHFGRRHPLPRYAVIGIRLGIVVEPYRKRICVGFAV
jgi:hypothetical protein